MGHFLWGIEKSMLRRFTVIFRRVLSGNSFLSSGVIFFHRALVSDKGLCQTISNTKEHKNKNAQSDRLKMDDNNKNVRSDRLKMGDNGKGYPLSPFGEALMKILCSSIHSTDDAKFMVLNIR